MFQRNMSSAFLACCLVCPAVSAQQETIALPTGGTSLLPKNAAGTLRITARPALAGHAMVPVGDQPFASALEVTVLDVPDQPWGLQAVTQIRGDIRKGDVLLFSCRVRCLESTRESGEGQLSINVQRNRAPYSKLLALPTPASRTWRHVLQPFHATMDLPDGAGTMTFHLGFLRQKLLIADIRLVNFGNAKALRELPTNVETYRGRSPDAGWRRDADRRIADLRRAPLRVVVKDAAGRPVPDVAVTVKMVRHQFTFGSAVAATLLAAETSDAKKYRAVVKENYNKVVFENDLKWGPWDVSTSNTNSTYRREWTERAFDWLHANHIAVRGHYITWAPLKPRQLAKYRGKGDLLRRDLWEHMQDKVPAVGAKVTDWDVINHIAGWGETIESVVGSRAIYADIVKRSRELAPRGVQMWINEGQILPSGQRIKAYEAVAQYLIDHGAAPDGIGFMGHFGARSLTPPEQLYTILTRFARLTDNLQITELDVNVGADEELQADYLRDVMTIAFSHPTMRSIIMWGFWEGRHWKPDAALYRRDWSIKPAGRVWRALVFEKWWTKTRGTTSAAGTFVTDGFLGDYLIEVQDKGGMKQVRTTLAKPGRTITVNR